LEENSISVRHDVTASKKHTTPLINPILLTALSYKVEQFIVQSLEIARGMIVEYYQIY
jgi:hypothetical protein